MNLEHPRIAIIGAGAVGGYYGARLAQHGHDVHFLLRGDYAAVSAGGVTVQSCDGDFYLPPHRLHVYDDARKMPQVDLVIVAIKASSNDQYEPLIRPLLNDRTAVLTLQNGLGNEARLAELFGPQRILGGLAFVCINRIGPGVIHHMDQGLVAVGDYVERSADGSDTGDARSMASGIVELFSGSRIRCRRLNSLNHGRWEKLLWNVPFNGLGAALGLTSDRLIASAEGLSLVRALMAEVMAGAAANGARLAPELADEKIELTRTMGAYKSSMQIDRELRRPMEVEAILGEPARRASRCGVQVPAMQMLYRMLHLVNLDNSATDR